MDVLQAIEHAEGDLAKTLAELQMARELVAALEQDAKKIQIEIVGLKSYANRQGLTEEPTLDADVVPISSAVELRPSNEPDLAMMSRSDAVATVMRKTTDPVDRAAIHEMLVDGGRFDSINDVSLTLSGLKRAGRVIKLGQGLWQIADAATAEAR